MKTVRENGAIVHDRRTEEDKARTAGFVVATDSFMSGWGKAPGRSLFAVPFADDIQAAIVERNMQHRSEMKRVRIVARDYPQQVKLSPSDHLSISDMRGSSRFYREGGFATDDEPTDPRLTADKALDGVLADLKGGA